MSLLACWPCTSWRRTVAGGHAHPGGLRHFAQHRLQSSRKEGWEGAGVKRCSEERLIYNIGDLEFALPLEVQLRAKVIDDYHISNVPIEILLRYGQCFSCSSKRVTD